jgi:cohesin loading factor subunit SCC2
LLTSLFVLLQWLRVGAGKDQISILRSGLESASIILFIVTAPNMDRRVLSEDAIKGVITLLRLHLSHHLIPALNPSGSTLVTSNQTKVAVKGDHPESPSATKRQRLSAPSEATTINANDLKKVYKHIVATMSLHLLLMDLLESLIRSLPLDDQQVLMLTSGVLPAFEIDCVSTSLSASKELFQTQQLQMASRSVLTAAFRMYPMHRDIILEDIFPILLNLPTSKRSLRTFPVRYLSSPSSKLEALNVDRIGSFLSNGSPPHYIQMITALVLSLVHSCVVRPSFAGEIDSKEDGTSPDSGPLQSGLRSCVSVADTFVACLLKRCSKTKGDNATEYRAVLLNVVEDLLLVLMIPEYPAAELVLSSLQRRLNHDLTLASPVFCSNSNGATQTEATYLNFAFDVLGKICAVQARILATARDKPLRIRTEDVPMSGPSEQDIDCHCHSSHNDVLLVQCDNCNALMHGPCVGFPDKESLPEGDWFCDSCALGRILCREQEWAGECLDELYAMRYSFQFTLVHQLGKVDESLKDPIHFHLSRWIEDSDRKLQSLKNKGSSSRRLVVSRLLDNWDGVIEPKKLTGRLTDDGCVRVILNLLAQTSPLLSSFRKQMEFLLKQMSSVNAPLLRKLSLKSIEKVSA